MSKSTIVFSEKEKQLLMSSLNYASQWLHSLVEVHLVFGQIPDEHKEFIKETNKEIKSINKLYKKIKGG